MSLQFHLMSHSLTFQNILLIYLVLQLPISIYYTVRSLPSLQITMTISGHCNVCNINDSRYKCPKCTVNYCSLSCFKLHKQENCQSKTKPALHETNVSKASINNTSDHNKEELVKYSALKVLRESKEMRNMLKNPYLRDLLVNLDKDPDHLLFENCMVEPEFLKFADVCLSILHPSDTCDRIDG